MLKAIEQLKKDIVEVRAENASLQSENKALNTKVEDMKLVMDEVNEKMTERKAIHSAVVTKESNRKDSANLFVKSLLLDRPANSFAEYADIKEKAIVPTDVPSWLAEEFSSELIERLTLELKVADLFRTIKIPDGRSTFSLPARTSDAVAYLIAPAVDAIESALTSGKVTFKTSRFKTLVTLSDQAEDETVTVIIDMITSQLVKSLATAVDSAILMGDITTAGVNNTLKAFDGLLKIARVAGNSVDGGGVALTATKVLAARKKLGVYGVNLTSLALVVPLGVGYDLLGVPEVLTVDKYGANATILKGELGKIYGISIVATELMGTNLTSLGVPDGAGTKTAAILVNKEYFAQGRRGNITLERDRAIKSSVDILVSWLDIDFQKLSVLDTPAVAIVNL